MNNINLKQIAQKFARHKKLNDFIEYGGIAAAIETIEIKNDVIVTLAEILPYDWKEDLGRAW